MPDKGRKGYVMALAKHIQVARTQGVEAGLEAYLDAPSSQRHPAYKRITRKRTPETQLAAYCEVFKDQLGKITPRLPQQQEAVENTIQEMIQNAVAQALASVAGAEAPAATSDGQVAVETEFITSGEAWEALIELGDDPDFPAPQNPERPATNGQLFRLNVNYGALSINV